MPIDAIYMFESSLAWGFVATVVMTTITQGSQGLRLSRLSLPFLVGTFFTGNRRWASVIGVTLYFIGGWAFALLYYLLFWTIGAASAWLGAIFGLVQGAFLLTVILPLLPAVHPRLATEYDGPSDRRRLEPPGFMGFNYGYRTPLVAMLGHMGYGAVLGGLFTLH